MTRTRGASGGGVGSSRAENDGVEALASLEFLWNGLRMDLSEEEVDILIHK